MQFIKGNGLRLRNEYLPAAPNGNDVVVISEEIQPAGPSMGQKAGSLSFVVGFSEVLSEYNLPNPVDFVRGMFGYHTKDEALASKFDSEFRTLGNGKFELNDILAFPVNWGNYLTEHLGITNRGPRYNAPGYVEFVSSGRPGVFNTKTTTNNNGNKPNNNGNSGNGENNIGKEDNDHGQAR